MPRDPASQRTYRAKKYARYKQLLAEQNAQPRYASWDKHYQELVNGAPFVRLTPAQLKCWWTERFTADEIRGMAGAIDFLYSEERGRRSVAA